MFRRLLINSLKSKSSSFNLNRFNEQCSTLQQVSSLLGRKFCLIELNSCFPANGLVKHCDLFELIAINLKNYQLSIDQQLSTSLKTITNNKLTHQSSKMSPNTTSNNVDQLQTNKPTKQVDEIICKFGVLTDAQFANCDDRAAWYNKDKTRYYRGAITHLKKAFDKWHEMSEKPAFVLQLGDLIDGLNKEIGCNSLEALEETLKIFQDFPNMPVFHAVGNHELYNFSRTDIAMHFRESLINRGRLNPDLVHLQLDFHDLTDENTMLYYKFIPIKGVKVIALDCFDISVIGHSEESAKYKEAAEILYKNNHSNFDLWDFDTHLEGLNKRFQTQNGGFSENQLKWLRNELKESEREGEKVIVFGHTGLHPDSCDASCLAYNYDKVLEIFNEVNCVVAYLSGHAHQSGYSIDENDVHYIVLHGIIETNPELDAYSTVTITKNRLIVEGNGYEQSFDLPLKCAVEQAAYDEVTSNSEESTEEITEASDATSQTESDKFVEFDEFEEQLAASSCVSVEVSV